MKKLWKQLWPWLVGLAIVVVLGMRLPLDAFREAVHEGPHLRLAITCAVILVAMLASDAFATWVSLIAVRVRWPLGDVLAIRGATYVLSLVNYVVGQGGVAYYLHKNGMPTLRATGVTLFMMGTTFVGLLLITTATFMEAGIDNAPLYWTLLVSCIAFVIYLVVIQLAPSFLAGRDVFAPLFEAGLRGHAITILARAPHVAVVVLGNWFAMLAWGMPVPFVVAMSALPVVALVTVLPISPGGLGTTQAALVYFFSDYAPGATDDARSAHVLAFAIVLFVYSTLFQLVAGLACIPAARRVQRTSD